MNHNIFLQPILIVFSVGAVKKLKFLEKLVKYAALVGKQNALVT